MQREVTKDLTEEGDPYPTIVKMFHPRDVLVWLLSNPHAKGHFTLEATPQYNEEGLRVIRSPESADMWLTMQHEIRKEEGVDACILMMQFYTDVTTYDS
jgi:hypothetical protein